MYFIERNDGSLVNIDASPYALGFPPPTHGTPCTLQWVFLGKGKTIPLQAWTGPEGFRRLRLQSAHEGGKVVSPTHRPPLHQGNISCYSFLLEGESTPGS